MERLEVLERLLSDFRACVNFVDGLGPVDREPGNIVEELSGVYEDARAELDEMRAEFEAAAEAEAEAEAEAPETPPAVDRRRSLAPSPPDRRERL